METEIKVPTVRPSLLLLNEYCLLEIFEFLDMNDSINLAKTSNRLRFLADRIFKIHAKVVGVYDEMINKGEEYIDHFFQHIGRHVISLDFHCCHAEHPNSNAYIAQRVKEVSSQHTSDVQPAYSFDNVELLTLSFSSDKVTEYFTKKFFESFHRLKYVNIDFDCIGSDKLKTLFQNNRRIENFSLMSGREFNCQLLELIPNVERLSLAVRSFLVPILELDSLLKLNRLTKLRLNCDFENVKNFLRELATKGLIEELELYYPKVDEDFFDTLASFSKLELLVIYGTPPNVTIKYPISWPAQLKKLRLARFELTKNDLITMIQQLESIECIDIEHCTIAKDDIHNFNDFAKLSREICNIVGHSNRKQRLDVALPKFVKPADPFKKYHFESDSLRIVTQPKALNPLGIKIHFPGS